MSRFHPRRVALLWLAAVAACGPSYGTNSVQWEIHCAMEFNAKQAEARYQQMQAESKAHAESSSAMWSDFARQQHSARINQEISRNFELSERRREAELQAERDREEQARAFQVAEAARRAAAAARALREAWEKVVHASPEAALAELDHNVLLSTDDRAGLLTYWSTRGSGEATYRLANFELQQGRKSTWITHLQTAAETQGHPAAKARLGDAYATGDGVAVDVIHAEVLYRQAASKDIAGGFVGLARLLQARGGHDTKEQVSKLMLFSRTFPSETRGDEAALDYCLKLSATEKAATFAQVGEALLVGAAPFPKAPGPGYAYLYVATALPEGEAFKARREAVERELDPDLLGRTLWELSRCFATEKSLGENFRSNWPLVFSLLNAADYEAARKKRVGDLAVSAATFGHLEAQLWLAANSEKFTKNGEPGAEWTWFYYSIALLSPGRPTASPAAQTGLARTFPVLSGLQRRHGALLVGEFFEKKFQGGGQAPILAEVWYRHAADLGDAEAMDHLRGLTAQRAPAESVKWKRQAAAAGSFEALIAEDNVKECLHADPNAFLSLLGWLCFYADKGNEVAMLRLADLYEQRARSPADLVGAYRWLRFLEWRLQEQKFWYDDFFYDGGNGPAWDDRGHLAESALPDVQARCARVAAKLTPGQRARALEQLGEWFRGLFATRLESPIRFPPEEYNDRWLSLQHQTKWWFEEAAKAGSAQALYQIGLLLNEGTFKPEALPYFRRAAAQGVTAAASRIAETYLEGQLVARDPIEAQAWHWFESEHPAGDPLVLDLMEDKIVTPGAGDLVRARQRYLEICEAGREFPRDPVRLWSLWAAMAATNESSVPMAQRRDSVVAVLSPAQLAQARFDCYRILLAGGFGVPKNARAAAVFLQEAAEAGQVEAECELALRFQNANAEGTLITQAQYEAVILWLGRAIQQGNALACVRMGHWIRRVDKQNAGAPASARLRVSPDFSAAAIAGLERRAAELGDTASRLVLGGPELAEPVDPAVVAKKLESLRTVARTDSLLESFLIESVRKELAENYGKGTPFLAMDTTRSYLWYAVIPGSSDDALERLRKEFLNLGGEIAVSELVALQREIRIAGLEYLD